MTELIQIGNPILRQTAKKIIKVKSYRVNKLIDELKIVMREKDLIGIAAPQIGIGQRIFLTELRLTKSRKISNSDKKELKVFINPEIIGFSDELIEMWEGCGSVAESNFFVPVIRPKVVTIKAYDQNGKSFVTSEDGLSSRVIQHEYDHLEGIVFLDRLCDFSRAMSAKEYYKIMKNK